MSDYIVASGDTTTTLKAMASVVQQISENFDDICCDCDNSSGNGGCHVNTADGCSILGCPLTKEGQRGFKNSSKAVS